MPLAAPGVTIEQLADREQLRLTLSGMEPDHCSLLQQYLPLQPNRSYRFEWHAETQGLETPTGLSWHLYGRGSEPRPSASDLLSSQQTWNFTSGDGQLFRLVLEYSRPLGSTLANGTVRLRALSLHQQP